MKSPWKRSCENDLADKCNGCRRHYENASMSDINYLTEDIASSVQNLFMRFAD